MKKKTCKLCRQQKDISDFHANRARCKVCYRKQRIEYYYKNRERAIEVAKAWQKRNPEKAKETYARMRVKYPHKIKARCAARHAMDRGQIKKLPCTLCGDENAQKHHEDYKQPLKVTWLCSTCHFKLHRKYSYEP